MSRIIPTTKQRSKSCFEATAAESTRWEAFLVWLIVWSTTCAVIPCAEPLHE